MMNNITGKTVFTFINESGDESTLSLDKFVADKLARSVGDIHAWIQAQYQGIIAGEECFAKVIKSFKRRGEPFSRRTIGDIIRVVAFMRIASEINDSEF
ncbi:MAG: hypothetical protein COZ86_04375 [Candidatus Moranbacteria bacterium CG_4_8_14_3_um_filter_41_13]|nr:MAG: hypothetical protein COZ86_04375 [Candidatus Moranbacteria bacterium CG_4_8_14_3_um_filter_41_13]